MDFELFKNNIEKINIESKKEIEELIENINITPLNFNEWIDNIFSEKIEEINLDKLPYIIDKLYQSDEKLKFMLSCMLIESTCDLIPFITPLENYPLFKEKFLTLKNTLITVYERVDNGIAACMEYIILNNDPKLELFTEEEKDKISLSSIGKLNAIKDYINNTEKIDENVYNDLELILDLTTYLKNKNINKIVNQFDLNKMTDSCKLFAIKYKLINDIKIENKDIEKLLENKNELSKIISVFESVDKLQFLPLDRITQEQIAKSNMIRWLEYPTELGKIPDDIELLDTIEEDNFIYYIYKFKSKDFRIKEYMVGISGGYPKNKKTSSTNGMTFSEFQILQEDYIKQGKSIIELIKKHWENR